MTTAAVNNSIAFLERQKEANCPCTIHTQERGYDWIVFNRMPDRLLQFHEDTDSDSDAEEETSGVGADTTTDPQGGKQEEIQCNNQDDNNASGASSEVYSSTDLTAGYHSIFNPTVSNSPCEFSLSSRDDYHIRCQRNDSRHTQKQKNPTKSSNSEAANSEDVEDLEEMLDEDILEESNQNIDSNKPCKFNPLVYRDNVNDKTYCFQYFRTYKYDWRLLLNHPNGEPVECKCPRGRLHNHQCPWYNPDVIYIPDKRNDLSASEQAAQAKIYNIYQNTKNNPPEICGCGTAAEIAYMGHKTTCEEFQWIHERSSYEILLAVLKKRKKVSFEHNSQQTKRPRLQSTSENDATKKEDQGRKQGK